MVAVTAELQPEGFAEIPPELAREKGIENLDWVTLSTARGEIETCALVTDRLRPFEIDGRRIYQIGMPWHFGWQGYATGDIANTLTAIVGDPNTTMQAAHRVVQVCDLRSTMQSHRDVNAPDDRSLARNRQPAARDHVV
jgi:formate dehydrogenase major subunit